MSIKKLADRLRELRGDLSYYEVGKATGVHRNHIKLYELGELMPTIQNLDRLAEYYEAKPELYYLYLDEVFPEREQREIISEWVASRLAEINQKQD
jgi:transcriptional regulator with XRE-family HTH domain